MREFHIYHPSGHSQEFNSNKYFTNQRECGKNLQF